MSRDRRWLASLLALALVGLVPLAPAAAAGDWADASEADIRPGVKALGSCTSNFVFANATEETAYLGTAAHCVELDDDYEVGDRVSIAGIPKAGTIVYSSWSADFPMKHPNDFALIEVREAYHGEVSPEMLGPYPGPTGTDNHTVRGDKVYTYGNTGVRDAASWLDAREGYVWAQDGWYLRAQILPSSMHGDSGSPLIDEEGRALGILSQIQYAGVGFGDNFNQTCVGCNIFTLVEPALDEANAYMDEDLHLVTVDADPVGLFPAPRDLVPD
jgi:hypothetical protein